MKNNTLSMLTILTVTVIMVCVVNKRDQDATLDQTVNYLEKSSVTQNITRIYLNTSDDVHSQIPHQGTSDKSTKNIIRGQMKKNRESKNCFYSGNNFNDILYSAKNKLMTNEKTNNSNLIMEPPVEEVPQRICSSLSYISPAGPVTGLASFPGSGNTWMRHLLQQSTGKYLIALKVLNRYVD